MSKKAFSGYLPQPLSARSLTLDREHQDTLADSTRKKNYFINQAYLSEYANMPAYRCELQDTHGIHLSGLEWVVYSHMWWCSTMPHGEGIREDKRAPIFDGNPYHPAFLGGIFVVRHLADNLDVTPEQIEEVIISLEEVGLIVSETQVVPTPDENGEWANQKEGGFPVYPLPYPRNEPVLVNTGETSSAPAEKPKQVYFIQGVETKRIKIGVSVDPNARLRSLVASEPLTLLKAIPGNVKEEKALHKRFMHLCIHGEWFEPDEELIRFIESL